MKTCTNHNLTGQRCMRIYAHNGAHKHISTIGVQHIWNWTPDRKFCNMQSRWLPIPPLWPRRAFRPCKCKSKLHMCCDICTGYVDAKCRGELKDVKRATCLLCAR